MPLLRTLITPGVIALSVFWALPGQAESIKLDCKDPSSKGNEARAMQQLAKDVVVRPSKHVLTIKGKSGTLKFEDKPPFDDSLDSITYHFCDRKEGFILLMHHDQDMFTGKLYNEETGKITPGGEFVLFSDDRRAYLIEQQPNGLDGSEWKIYAVNGQLSWSGFNFIQRDDDRNMIDADLNTPAWTASGELTAQAQCQQKPQVKWQVKLVKKAGEWSWQPRKKCS
ncbi:hypothetical protein [Undibacterium sp. TS12]|uniref:hypothetical protein n=1 Tax=Undibacterium sp. TS12 TaxID=2908202 RepID=UPI001F4C98A2|nr:hypothetical protein [Undibacterium sp. TS12]MCH8619532.1 hypothetical protein [Undibacterium sp. TS12]